MILRILWGSGKGNLVFNRWGFDANLNRDFANSNRHLNKFCNFAIPMPSNTIRIALCFKSWLLARVLDQKVAFRARFGASRWVLCVDVARNRTLTGAVCRGGDRDETGSPGREYKGGEHSLQVNIVTDTR